MRNAAREAVQEAIRDGLLSGRETSGRLGCNGQNKAFFSMGRIKQAVGSKCYPRGYPGSGSGRRCEDAAVEHGKRQ
jgi:hypothetical protein